MNSLRKSQNGYLLQNDQKITTKKQKGYISIKYTKQILGSHMIFKGNIKKNKKTL